MGCDIHPCIEVRSKRSGNWVLKESGRKYWRRREREGLAYEDMVKVYSPFFRAIDGRNYTLFSVLADVRSYGEGIIPLFANRGLPKDASKSTLRDIPENDSDYHSHTYFTLAELLATDWDAQSGGDFEVCLYAHDYLAWKETGKVPANADTHPENSDDSTREVTEEEMTLLLLGHGPDKLVKMKVNPYESKLRSDRKRKGLEVDPTSPKYKSGPFVKVGAPLTYRQLIPHFVEAIEHLKGYGEPDDVRVLIAFDN